MPPKKKKKRSKAYSKLKHRFSKFQVDIIKKSNAIDHLGLLRKQTPANKYPEIITWLHTAPLGQDKYGPPFPKTYSDLYKNPPVTSIGTNEEISWCYAYLKNYSAELSNFVTLSNDFHKEFLLGNFGKAEEILTSIENQFGVSFWLVKTKISFLQHTRGLEAQKEYTKHIVERGCRNGFLAFSSHEYSISIEPAASIGNFAERMERAISQNYPSCFKTFWSYHLLLSLHLTQQQINEMLRMESSGAVIDLYETLISTGQISLNLEYFDLATEINRILTKLNISDGRTGIINWLATDSLPPTISHHKATRLFFEGDYDQAHETAILELKDNPASIDLIDIAARSAAICKKDIVKSESPLSTIISGLMKVILYSDPDRIDGKNLLKFALSFAPAGWASFVCSLLLRQLSNKPNSDISGLLPLSIISCNEVGLFSAKYMITSGHKNKYYQLFKKTHNEDFLDCYFGTCKLGECKKLPSLEAKYICLINKIINEKYDEAIRIAEEFLTKNNSNQNSFDYYRIKGLRAKAFALFTNGNLIECTEFITNTLASEYNLLDLFPVKSLVESFDKQLLNDNAANISISIVHDIYHKEVDQKLEHLRRYSYLDFLEAHKIKRPSQLREIENNFDKKELIYFLQFLCVEQNMDLAFSGSEQVAKERAAVCKYLTELCPSETETYQSEIKDIYRQLMVKKKAHEVEKSKIYVDLTSLKMEARKDFKEKYDRYKSYLSEGLDEKSFEYLSKLRETVKDRDTKTIFGLKAPDNEMTSVATSLITGLRDIFVSNTQHGLDGYLCVRIRHNTLPAKLRGPLETESLITNVDSNTQKYKENNALFEKLNVHDPSLKAGLVNCFNDFANKYDSLLKKINKEWIQVKTNSDETGLFDLTLYRPHIGLITSQIEEDTSFDEFVDTVFEVFFELLETSLKSIRFKLQYEAKKEAISLLEELTKNVVGYKREVHIGPVLRSIQSASTKIQFAFDRVTEWFNLYQTAEKQPFKIDEAIEIGKQSIKTFCPQFEVKLNIDEIHQDSYISGNLASFVDIIFNIFENIAKYSGFEDNIVAIINISIETDEIILEVTNEVATGIFEQSSEKVENLQKSIDQSQQDRLLRTEGGTGFYKIKKILNHDFNFSGNKNPLIEFGFDDRTTFTVRVRIPYSRGGHL